MIDSRCTQAWLRALRLSAACWLTVSLGACGGGGSNPLDNPPSVNNATLTAGQKLAFAYFQQCIHPILVAQTCSASGCHDSVNGTGGALRLIPSAAQIDLSSAANTPEAIRNSDMYKNFYSAQGSSAIGSPAQSKLLNKPLVLGVLHGGGLIFQNAQDPNVKRIEYWIARPAAQNQDEFSASTYSMFTPQFDPANASASTCNTQ
ncbi:MAG: hypothetical protein WA210_02360 [Burkholderiaceae bacterium]